MIDQCSCKAVNICSIQLFAIQIFQLLSIVTTVQRIWETFNLPYFFLLSIPSDFNAINVNTFFVPQALCIWNILYSLVYSVIRKSTKYSANYLYFLLLFVIKSDIFFFFSKEKNIRKKSLRYPVDWCLKEKHSYLLFWRRRVLFFIQN